MLVGMSISDVDGTLIAAACVGVGAACVGVGVGSSLVHPINKSSIAAKIVGPQIGPMSDLLGLMFLTSIGIILISSSFLWLRRTFRFP
jgi:hypothetical protein